MTDKEKAVSLHSKSVGLVAQLDRVPDYGSGGCGFDSRPVHKRKSRNRFPFLVLCISTEFYKISTNLHESTESSKKKTHQCYIDTSLWYYTMYFGRDKSRPYKLSIVHSLTNIFVTTPTLVFILAK